MVTDFPYELIDLWINRFPNIKILGPLSCGSLEYNRALDFRRETSAPYLDTEEQREIENSLKIDERSLHFAVEVSGKIAAYVRATPAPFESAELATELKKRVHHYSDYFEFSRLCTHGGLARKSLYASLLVVKAAQVIFSKKLANGIVGICRLDRSSYMARLGLSCEKDPIWLATRAANYQLVKASKEELLNFYWHRLHETFAPTATADLAPISPAPVEVLSESFGA